MHWINNKINAFVSQLLVVMGILSQPKSKTDVWHEFPSLWKVTRLKITEETHKTGQGLNLQKFVSAAVCLLCASVLVHWNHTLQDLLVPIRTRLGHVLPSSRQIPTKEKDGTGLMGAMAYVKGTYTSSRRQQTGWQVRPFIVSWLWKGKMSLPASLPHLSHRSYVLPDNFSFPQSIAMPPAWQEGPGSPDSWGDQWDVSFPLLPDFCFCIN